VALTHGGLGDDLTKKGSATLVTKKGSHVPAPGALNACDINSDAPKALAEKDWMTGAPEQLPVSK